MTDKDGRIPKIEEEYDYSDPYNSDSSFSCIVEEDLTHTQDESHLDATASKSASQNASCEVRELHKTESKRVDFWRDIVTCIIILFACGLSLGSYLYLSKDEVSNFQNSFEQYTQTMEHSAREMEVNLQKSLATVADQITSYASTSGSKWPRVTMSFFQRHADKARASGFVEYLSFCPLVEEYEQADWEAYALENQGWLLGDDHQQQGRLLMTTETNSIYKTIPSQIFQLDSTGQNATKDLGKGPYAPRWQTSPLPKDTGSVNYDVISSSTFLSLYMAMMTTRGPVTSEALQGQTASSLYYFPENHIISNQITNTTTFQPTSIVLYPILDSFQDQSTISGLLEVMLNWEQILSSLLPEGSSGVSYTLKSSCGDMHSYELRDGTLYYMGEGNRHDGSYTSLEREIALITNLTSSDHIRSCTYSLLAYPGSELEDTHSSDIPEIFTAIVAILFLILAIFFFLYHTYVQRRSDKMVRQAIRSNEIVASFFPKNIRDRLINEGAAAAPARRRPRSHINSSGGVAVRLKRFMSLSNEPSSDFSEINDKPIADLFPHCTVLFADIVGFTAWSSMREPTQVLLLLESIYRAFDEIAKRRRVFKVETIGDCYVAVTGLPEPNEKHGLIMAKFARDIMFKVHEVTKSLEVSLGPDTGDLSIRVGMHSGPVTAGVLRADRLRFQLFGDTVNTAARIESTGNRGCVHLSKETAAAISEAGKPEWVKERADKVTAKGKGELTTFWLSLQDSSSGASYRRAENLTSMDFSVLATSGHDMSLSYFSLRRANQDVSAKIKRLIKWNVEVLVRILRQIAATRLVTESQLSEVDEKAEEPAKEKAEPKMVLEEVSEIITLPKFAARKSRVVAQATEADIAPVVVKQVDDFVTKLAALYHNNPFHNFEHASHVAMSVVKLLSRIVAPADVTMEGDESLRTEKRLLRSLASKMHDHTYGITSDPLTQFAVVLSALMHDADHVGVSNAQLVKEETETAKRYMGKSVAEQNSVDLAWKLLMKPEYTELRKAIAGNDNDWKRFRQLVVNSVMATDIIDKELKELRNARWDKAFSDEFQEGDADTDRNRKATIVIEHLIQASDVSHTMQHWHIYRKWNERLFKELYKAYKFGRMEKDPSEFWFKGEIGFFEFYIIPLAKKLKECGVFGVSSDEYLNYAEQNLAEWKNKGEQVVQEMLAAVKAEYAMVEGRRSARRLGNESTKKRSLRESTRSSRTQLEKQESSKSTKG